MIATSSGTPSAFYVGPKVLSALRMMERPALKDMNFVLEAPMMFEYDPIDVVPGTKSYYHDRNDVYIWSWCRHCYVYVYHYIYQKPLQAGEKKKSQAKRSVGIVRRSMNRGKHWNKYCRLERN